MIISYFDKVTKVKYISTSITQLALRLEVHRNTISNWICDKEYYEDDTCLVFCIDSKALITQNRTKKLPITMVNKTFSKIEEQHDVVQYIGSNAQEVINPLPGNPQWKQKEVQLKKWDGKLKR